MENITLVIALTIVITLPIIGMLIYLKIEMKNVLYNQNETNKGITKLLKEQEKQTRWLQEKNSTNDLIERQCELILNSKVKVNPDNRMLKKIHEQGRRVEVAILNIEEKNK